ncbi:MAG TPA: hypothetical protein VFM54_05090 [Micromonosporaceae bacterium]|nr:hypothetical protein [Micromonosporaceae bacterium]
MDTNRVGPTQIRPASADGGRLLRLALKLDALATGALGLLLAAAGPLLDSALGIPTSVLVGAGLFLAGYGGALAYVGTRPAVSYSAAWAAVAVNALWVVLSVLLIGAGWFGLTVLGVVFVLVQAAAVAIFVDLQFLGLRRAGPALS